MDLLNLITSNEMPGVKPCPECGSLEMETEKSRLFLPGQLKGEKSGINQLYGMSLICVGCKNCGYLRFFNGAKTLQNI